MSSAPAEKNVLVSIQLLRALAAIMVVLGHAQTEAAQMVDRPQFTTFDWGFGVDIFFVISGFIMVFTSEPLFGKPHAPQQFIWRRIIRIVPLYWFFTAAMVTATIFMPQQLEVAQFDLQQILLSLIFVPSLAADGQLRPLLALGWTLNYEMFFYLVFAGTLIFAQGRALRLLAIVLLALVTLGWLLHPQLPALTFWTNAIILEFLYGCGLGYLFAKSKPGRSPLAFAMLAPASVTLYYILNHALALPLDRSISHGLPAAMIVFATVFHLPGGAETRLRSLGRFLGDSSYSLYLSHPFSLAILKLIWPFHTSLRFAFFGYVAVALLFAILVGRLCFTLVEQPVLRLLRRLGEVRQASAVAPSS